MNSSSSNDQPLLEVKQLKKFFPVRSGLFSKVSAWVKAVDDVTFDILPGETFGLVGESGCGKTTVGRTILRLMEPSGGDVIFEGDNIFSMNSKTLRSTRRRMQIIFQDPYSSLNPRMTVGSIVGEPLLVHKLAKGQGLTDRVYQLLNRVGLRPEHYSRYPHEFSGGQRQRIGVARALALNPKLILADEPVSALDVSIQSQILNLLQDLQDEFKLTYLFIAHDLAVIEHISTRVAVMYLGIIAEIADSTTLYKKPLHPYTKALLSAVPIPDPVVERKRQRIILEGDVPSPDQERSGCYFYERCPNAMAGKCKNSIPPLEEVEKDHQVACFLYFDPE